MAPASGDSPTPAPKKGKSKAAAKGSAKKSAPAKGAVEDDSVCQVPGCEILLASMKVYNQRCRVCQEHLLAGAVDFEEQGQKRFCQQCARFHPVEEFDGAKRSCRLRLERHKLQCVPAVRRPFSTSSTGSCHIYPGYPVHIAVLQNRIVVITRPPRRLRDMYRYGYGTVCSDYIIHRLSLVVGTHTRSNPIYRGNYYNRHHIVPPVCESARRLHHQRPLGR